MTTTRRALAVAAVLAADIATIWFVLTLLFHHLPALHSFDLATQRQIHALAAPRFTAAMLTFTWLGSIRIFAPALACAVLLVLYQRRRRLAATLGLPMLGALLLNEALKLHFHRPRPIVPWFFPGTPAEHTFSFPSGHSFFAVVLYGTLAYIAISAGAAPRRAVPLTLISLVLTLAIGFSRIYLGEHYPTDVLAGYLAGLLWLTAIILIDRASTVPKPSEPHS